jgi:hypothetical protein
VRRRDGWGSGGERGDGISGCALGVVRDPRLACWRGRDCREEDGAGAGGGWSGGTVRVVDALAPTLRCSRDICVCVRALVGCSCVATAYNNIYISYQPKKFQDFLLIVSALRIIIF